MMMEHLSKSKSIFEGTSLLQIRRHLQKACSENWKASSENENKILELRLDLLEGAGFPEPL